MTQTIGHYSTATEMLTALRERRISSRELVELHLARIEARDGTLNAIPVRTPDRARAAAARADAALAKGERGALLGLPMTLKESTQTAGLPQSAGIEPFRDYRPAQDGPLARRVFAAGACLLGKTNIPVALGDWQADSPIYGRTHNPWDPTRTPGGSTGGGGAALAAGMTPLEIGSDIGGSIRVPSHWSGVCGHKPTWGIVPQRGHIPPPPGMLAPPDLNVCGPIARTVDDLSLALDVLAGPGELDAVGWRLELPPARRSRLGDYRVTACFQDATYPVDASVRALLESAVERLRRAGVAVRVLEKPPVDLAAARRAYDVLLLPLMAGSFPEGALAAFKQLADSAPADDPNPAVATARAFTASHITWIRANEERERLRAAMHELFHETDVLLLPVNQLPAIPHMHEPEMPLRTLTVNGKSIPYTDLLNWIAPATMCKLPASVVPVGRTPDGLPVGVQIVGSHLEDKTTLDFARRLAELTGGFTPPPGF
jgi:amidase